MENNTTSINIKLTNEVKIIFCATDYNPGDQISVNIYTDGFTKLSGLPELQLTVPLGKNYILNILNRLMQGFLQGKKPQENVKLQILPGYPPIILKTISEFSGQEYLRVIMPDKEGHYPDKSTITPYKEQLEPEPYRKNNFKKLSLVILNYKEETS